jgi:hypothetical protein
MSLTEFSGRKCSQATGEQIENETVDFFGGINRNICSISGILVVEERSPPALVGKVRGGDRLREIL